jgi:hypothetical protein
MTDDPNDGDGPLDTTRGYADPGAFGDGDDIDSAAIDEDADGFQDPADPDAEPAGPDDDEPGDD